MRIKKHLLLFTVVAALFLSIGCESRKYNNIEYPASFYLGEEIPGDPITLELRVNFIDETPDTVGVNFEWAWYGDTLWILLEGTEDESVVHEGRAGNSLPINVGQLAVGNYPILFEGEEGEQNTFLLTVEDSLYVLSGDDSTVAWLYYGPNDTLHRIFPDFLITGICGPDAEGYSDSLHKDFLEIGASELSLSSGKYTGFSITSGAVIGVGDDCEYWIGGPSWVFSYSGDTTSLKEIFNDYANRSGVVGVIIWLGTGEKWFACYPW